MDRRDKCVTTRFAVENRIVTELLRGIIPLGGFDLSLVIIYATRYKYRTLNECCVIFPEISPVPVNPVNHPSLAVSYFTFPTKLFYFENDIVTTCGFIISKKKIVIPYTLFEHLKGYIFGKVISILKKITRVKIEYVSPRLRAKFFSR